MKQRVLQREKSQKRQRQASSATDSPIVRKVKKVLSFPSLLAAAATNTASGGWANLTLSFKNGKCAAATSQPPSTAALECHPKARRKTWKQTKSAPARQLVPLAGGAAAGGEQGGVKMPASTSSSLATPPRSPSDDFLTDFSTPPISKDLARVKRQDHVPSRLKRASSGDIFGAFVSVCESVRAACSPRSVSRKQSTLSGS